MKLYIKYLIIPFLFIFIYPLIGSIFNLFGIGSNSIINLIVFASVMYLSGYIIGINFKTKGYLRGLYLGLMVTIPILLIDIIFYKVKLITVIYLVIICSCSVAGAMLGINIYNKK